MTAMLRERTSEKPRVMPENRYRATPNSRLFTPIPISQVMVPLGGAPFSERALPHAMAVAAAAGADVSLVFVETPESQSERRAPDFAAMDPIRYLAEMRARLGLRVPLVNARVVHATTLARGCVNAEPSEGTDLVVLATPLCADAASRGIASLTSEVIRSSSAPVLLIPPDSLPAGESVHVLVPLDGSGRAEYALFPVIALANASRGRYINEITLLTVCEEEQAISAATSYLEDVRTSLGRLIVPTIQTHSEVGDGRAAEAILRSIGGPTTRRFDMLAMTTRGQGGYGGKLFGSVADFVLSRADVPMLVVNPRHN